MSWFSHSKIDATTLADTATGGAGSTTGLAGFYTDEDGATWNIVSHLIQSDPGGGQATDVYSHDNPTLNQQVVITFPAGSLSSKRATLRFRYRVVVATAKYAQVYINLAGAIYAYATDDSGGIAAYDNSGALGLNNAHAYRFTVNLTGADGAAPTLSVQIFDVTAASPFLWNSGSDTYTFTYPGALGISHAGAFRLVADSATYSIIDYQDDQTPPTLTPGAGTTVVVDSTSATATFATPTGGTGPYTTTYSVADDVFSTNLRSISGLFTVTGSAGSTQTLTATSTLTADKSYILGQNVTDSAAVTASGFDIGTGSYLTKLTGFRTLRTLRPVVSIIQIGDSTTVGGSPNSSTTAASIIADRIGISGITVASTAIAGGGLVNFVNSDGTPTSNLTDAVSQINSNSATDLWSRLGINDTITDTDFKMRMAALIAYVRANCPTIKRILMLPMFMRITGAPDECCPQATDNDRVMSYIVAEEQLAAADTGSGGVAVKFGSRKTYYYWQSHLSLKADALHVVQAGWDATGLMDAEDWLTLFGADFAPTVASGGGGGAPLIGSSLIR